MMDEGAVLALTARLLAEMPAIPLALDAACLVEWPPRARPCSPTPAGW